MDSVEQSVGISSFLQEGKKIDCLFKYRFADFVVNEISQDGTIIFLKDADLWKDFASVKQSHQDFLKKAQNPQENPFHAFELKPNFEEEAQKLLGQEQTQKLLELVDMLKVNPHMRHFEVQVPLPDSKEDRVAIHQFVRDNLPFLDSVTYNSHNTKKNQKQQKEKHKNKKITQEEPKDEEEQPPLACIAIKVSPINFKRFKTKAFRKDDQEVQKYVHFTLMKRNVDSINAGILISKFLNISNKHFQMAGIKDKRGVTSQRCCLQGITIDQLEEMQQRNNWNKNIVLNDYVYSSQQLTLGDLYGNRFAVTLRFVGDIGLHENWDIIKNIENLKLNGYINYFGLQRFGVNRETKTHDIGRFLIRKQWKDVVHGILKGVSCQDPYVKEAIYKYVEDGNAKILLRSLPPKLRVERQLAYGLDEYGNNYLSAFMTLPKNSREIYAHAYQSYLWNKVASLRIQAHGNEVVVGDLVIKTELAEEAAQEVEIEEELLEEDVNDVIKVPVDKSAAILVTEQNKHEFQMKDVVLPIYGSQTDLPAESVAQKLLNLVLAEDGILLEEFNNLPSGFILKGGYRKLICHPEKVEHEIVNYETKDQDLVNPFYQHIPTVHIEGGKYKALVLKFTLKKSGYATMLIRELTKTSSSLEYQQKLGALYV